MGPDFFSTFFSTTLPTQDLLATIVTFAAALTWLQFVKFLVQRGWLDQKLSRKIIHIGTGPLFLLCWPLFSTAPIARFLAALVPLVLTLQFLAIGLQLIKQPAAVQAMTRNGNPAELLRGPLYYGLIFILCTLLFWRNSPVGILALMLMCGGDGLAEIVGRRFGQHKLPFGSKKSWAGSAAMLLGGFALGESFLALFNYWGYFQPALHPVNTVPAVAGIALAATAVEALPFEDIDNLTLPAVTLALGSWLF